MMPAMARADTSDTISSRVQLLADVLRNNKFAVPAYQRPYSWDPENVRTLLQDLARSIAQNRSHYFLGPVMFMAPGPDERCDIVDGQQRIATFSLICAYLCQRFHHDAGATQEKESLMHLLFDLPEGHGKTLDDANDLEHRVILSENEKTEFALFLGGNPLRRGRHITTAWHAIEQFFWQPDYASSDGLKGFLDFLLRKLKVAWIQFEEADDAITIFETQNTRGKPLESIQLVCSYFHICLRDNEAQRDHLQRQLNNIRTTLDNNERTFFRYTHCVAQCRYGHLSKDDFVRDLRDAISKKDEVKEVYEFVRELEERVLVFKQLVHPSSGAQLWEKLTNDANPKDKKRTVADYVKDLHSYPGVSNAIMFALLCRYVYAPPSRKKETAKFVNNSCKLLASFFQRASHSIPGSFAPKNYEKEASSLALAVANGSCKTVSDFFERLSHMHKNDIINDDNYIRSMKIIDFKLNAQRAKYILMCIDRYQQEDADAPTKAPSLEHILPAGAECLSGGWKFTKEEHESYCDRLGNLTLLAADDARPGDNDNFKAKKKLYQQSSYSITQEVGDKKIWSVKSIENRQEDLAKVAAQVWNFD